MPFVKGDTMTVRKKIRWMLVLAAVALLLPAGCGKKVIGTDAMMDASAADAEAQRLREEEARRQAERDRQRAVQEGGLTDAAGATGAGAAMSSEQFVNEDVFFEFDSSVLTADSQEQLRRKAEWLLAHPMVNVIIEGHCDVRGTNEYNLALGERRAQSVKSFMADLGVEERRMRTLSYGEERPLMSGDSEEAWSRNRRAHFEFNR
jgi:peptidoglycan-associated lipoprotein